MGGTIILSTWPAESFPILAGSAAPERAMAIRLFRLTISAPSPPH